MGVWLVRDDCVTVCMYVCVPCRHIRGDVEWFVCLCMCVRAPYMYISIE
jgi:hypothetical protein